DRGTCPCRPELTGWIDLRNRSPAGEERSRQHVATTFGILLRGSLSRSKAADTKVASAIAGTLPIASKGVRTPNSLPPVTAPGNPFRDKEQRFPARSAHCAPRRIRLVGLPD